MKIFKKKKKRNAGPAPKFISMIEKKSLWEKVFEKMRGKKSRRIGPVKRFLRQILW